MPENSSFLNRLSRLSLRPPQVLLLEGGSESARLSTAVYWAQLHNCPQALHMRAEGNLPAPCCACPVCRQLSANEYVDLFIYDGRISNREDEEKPGPVRALRMENMRELKSLTGEAPRGPGKRIAIFQGMSQTREEALNSLLKTLEEPSPHTLFVLLAPQRAQLLPTLVSRSFCLTLPWTGADSENEEMAEWLAELGNFLKTGTSFLEKVGLKNALDSRKAGELLAGCQNSLIRIAADLPLKNSLDAALKNLKNQPQKFSLASAWIEEGQEMLVANVNPARVLEALGSRLYCLLRQKP